MSELSPNLTKVIGIDVFDAKLRFVVLAGRGEILISQEKHLETESSFPEQITALVVQIQQQIPDVQAVGVAIPGLVRRENGQIVLSTQFPSLVGANLAGLLREKTNLPTILENDANSAAIAEYELGAGQNCQSLFYATIGKGVGGAIILDGKLWHGITGFAGEFGHITINEEGLKLENVASASNIIRRTRERLRQDSTSSLSRISLNPDFTVDSIVREANEGDDFAQLMIERTGIYIGTAIASVINLLNVERVVIGGEVMETGEVILNSIVSQAKQLSFAPSFEATTIVSAQLGANSTAIGAALLAAKVLPE